MASPSSGSPLGAVLPVGAFLSFELVMLVSEARADVRAELETQKALAKAERKLSGKAQLIAEARELGISGRSKMNAKQLTAAIKKARRQAAPVIAVA